MAHIMELRKSWQKLLEYYPYFKDGSELGEVCSAVKDFVRNLSLQYNSFGSCDTCDFVGAQKKNRLLAISLALVIMSYLQSEVDTWDDRKKASAKVSKLLWDEWGKEHFSYYTGAEFSFDDNRLKVYQNALIETLYSEIVKEHPTILQKIAGSFYRYLYKEVDSFKKSTDRLIVGKMMDDSDFHFPFI